MDEYQKLYNDMKEIADQRANLIEYWKNQAYKEKQRADYLYDMIMDFTYMKKEIERMKNKK